jgi:hypothetical protein
VLYRQGLDETAAAITTKCYERGASIISSDADQNVWVAILVHVDDHGRRLQDLLGDFERHGLSEATARVTEIGRYIVPIRREQSRRRRSWCW